MSSTFIIRSSKQKKKQSKRIRAQEDLANGVVTKMTKTEQVCNDGVAMKKMVRKYIRKRGVIIQEEIDDSDASEADDVAVAAPVISMNPERLQRMMDLKAPTANTPVIADDGKVFEDEMLPCRDCSSSFVFTATDQATNASKGFTNKPARCICCKKAHREMLARAKRSKRWSGLKKKKLNRSQPSERR